jgi:F-type H+-transporting ATPase subunit b
MKFPKSLIAVIVLISLPIICLSAPHGGKEMKLDEHAKTIIISQTINLLILVVAIYFLAKKAIVKFFSDRQSQYLESAEKTKAVVEKAKAELSDLQARMKKLDDTAKSSIEGAAAEAVRVRGRSIEEAQENAKRIKEESRLTISAEALKASLEVRKELIAEATSIASSQLSAKLSSEDHLRLQGDFLNNMQGAQK